MQVIDKKETFEELINGDKVIVKFEADWCPDCKRLNMFIGEIMEDFSSVGWYEINRDQFPEIADKYQVMGIPSLLIFEKGEKLAHLHSANAKTPEEVREFLENNL
ncbi:thioredoxin family protein [Pullulanibacillus sp. KACC 23026]|uniref:thioredoxin family protein n=1 Tax=Pullulanibacillus sp. KACC 23026 TaxID=3028315 RepID=UPI0023AEB5D3|nr:thioredoxin family protein [Pullulanibacillus sp. KACC 23026]WEG14377.1 thioredoxin family protein [Pullulanibacillus sp. KACC 23026]